jgi:hypothetical protein
MKLKSVGRKLNSGEYRVKVNAILHALVRNSNNISKTSNECLMAGNKPTHFFFC